MQTSTPHNTRILRLPEVKRLTGQSRSTIYSNMRDGKFPASVHLGPRAIGWLEHEVIGWINQRVKESRSQDKARA